MSVKTIIVRQCDKCGKIIEGRLTLHTCPCCQKDICVSCQEKEDNKHKPREPRERKPKAEPIAVVPPELREMEEGLNSEGLTLKKARKSKDANVVDDVRTNPTMANIDIHTPAGEEKEFKVRILDSFAQGENLRETILEALKPWGGVMPLGLAKEEAEFLQGILAKGSNDNVKEE